jgi:hypothetical protein
MPTYLTSGVKIPTKSEAITNQKTASVAPSKSWAERRLITKLKATGKNINLKIREKICST